MFEIKNKGGRVEAAILHKINWGTKGIFIGKTGRGRAHKLNSPVFQVAGRARCLRVHFAFCHLEEKKLHLWSVERVDEEEEEEGVWMSVIWVLPRRLPHLLVTSGPELRAAWAQRLYTLGGYMSPMSNQLRLGGGGA